MTITGGLRLLQCSRLLERLKPCHNWTDCFFFLALTDWIKKRCMKARFNFVLALSWIHVVDFVMYSFSTSKMVFLELQTKSSSNYSKFSTKCFVTVQSFLRVVVMQLIIFSWPQSRSRVKVLVLLYYPFSFDLLLSVTPYMGLANTINLGLHMSRLFFIQLACKVMLELIYKLNPIIWA